MHIPSSFAFTSQDILITTKKLISLFSDDYVSRSGISIDAPDAHKKLISDLKVKVKQRFPFSDDELREYEMFDLFVFDGGGFFATVKLVGETNDEAIARAVSSETFWECIGGINSIDWETFARERRIEEHVWLHRWYYFMSLGRMYWLTHDEQYARLFQYLYLDWFNKHLLPPEVVQYKQYPIWWKDMQVVWRVIVGICTFRLFSDSKVLDEAFWTSYLLNLLTGADMIYQEDKQINKLRGNHQSHLEMGLAYASAIFQEHHSARMWWEHAIDWLTRHLKRFDTNFYSYEISPSYATFVIQHFRDTVLLAEKNNLPVPSNFAGTVEKACKALVATMQPDRRLVPLTDAYSLDIRKFIRMTSRRMQINNGNWDIENQVQELPVLAVFPETGIGSIRSDWSNDALFGLLDFSPGPAGHWHGGKLAVDIYAGSDAILVDPGCSDYCVSEFEELRQPISHNSLIVDGYGDSRTLPGRPWSWADGPVCKFLNSGVYEGVAYISAESLWPPRPVSTDGRVKHRRLLALVDRSFFVIGDIVECSGEHEFIFPLHLANLPVQIPADKNIILISGKNGIVELIPQSSSNINLFVAPGKISLNGRLVRSLVVYVAVKGKDMIRFSMIVAPASRKLTNFSTRSVEVSNMIFSLLERG